MIDAFCEDPLEPPSPEPDPASAESRIIARVLASTLHATPSAHVGPGDDAAVLASGEVLTTDLLVEGVHFDARSDGEDVGFKAVAVSVSDLAAMGAAPHWMLLCLALPADDAFASALARGVGQACERWGVELVGGDTTGTPGPRFIGVTMGGRCPGAPLLRSTGRPGDRILVTGVPGLAARGYTDAHAPAPALLALRRPSPSPALGIALARVASAGMDLSDGLAADLPRLCAASRVGARIDPAALPDHPALHGGPVPARTLQLAGGDDYALLITVPPELESAALEIAAAHGEALTSIGHLTPGRAVQAIDGPWPAAPWSHHAGAP